MDDKEISGDLYVDILLHIIINAINYADSKSPQLQSYTCHKRVMFNIELISPMLIEIAKNKFPKVDEERLSSLLERFLCELQAARDLVMKRPQGGSPGLLESLNQRLRNLGIDPPP